MAGWPSVDAGGDQAFLPTLSEAIGQVRSPLAKASSQTNTEHNSSGGAIASASTSNPAIDKPTLDSIPPESEAVVGISSVLSPPPGPQPLAERSKDSSTPPLAIEEAEIETKLTPQAQTLDPARGEAVVGRSRTPGIDQSHELGESFLVGSAGDEDLSSAAGGNASAAARALRETAQQRDLLQRHLEDLTRSIYPSIYILFIYLYYCDIYPY
jgi:hypothetical protein